jgi:hypothetical protein
VGACFKRSQTGQAPGVTILGVVLMCFGGGFIGSGYGAVRRGKPDGRAYVATGVVLLVAGIVVALV